MRRPIREDEACLVPTNFLRLRRVATRSDGASCASDPTEDVGEFFLHLLPQLRACARNHLEIIDSLERPAGIDDGTRIGRARLVEQGIEWAAPGAAHALAVVYRIAAR